MATAKVKEVSLIYGAEMFQQERAHADTIRTADKLGCDKDFEVCKLDQLCQEILTLAKEVNKGSLSAFCAWEEIWEKQKVGPQGDAVFEAKLVKKYQRIW